MDQAPLVGRSTQLDALDRVLAAARLGEPAIVLLEGEAGMGKTRLLDELEARASADGGIVLRGSAPPPTGQPLPFAVLSQVLRDALRKLPDGEREAIVAATPELAILQPAWHAPGAAPAASTSMTAVCERVLDVLEAVAAGRAFALVMLDDLHWADAGTLDVVTYLTRAPRQGPIAVVLSTRADDADPQSAMRLARAGILRGRVDRIALGPLADDEAAGVLEGLAPGSGAAQRQQWRALAGGNPLYLTELAAGAGPGADQLPENLVALVGDRLSSRTPGEQAVLRVLATAGDGLATEHLVRVLDAPDGVVFEAVRSLVAARLLVASDDGILTVAQPLVCQIVAASVLEPERRRIHAAIARAMAASPDADPRPEVERLVRLAEHWHAAGDRLRALPALLRAAAECERVLAFGTAFELYRRARADMHAGGPATPDDRQLGFRSPAAGGGDHRPDAATLDLERRAIDAAVLAGRAETGVDWADEALAGLPPSRERSAIQLARGRALLATGDAGGAVRAFESTIDVLDPVPASAYTGLTRALVAAGSAERGVSAGESAVRAARASSSTGDEVAALLALGTALATAGRSEEALGRIQEARAMRHERATPSIMLPRMSRVIDLSGGMAEAARAVRAAGIGGDGQSLVHEAQATAVSLGAEGEAARLRLEEASAAFDVGRWDEAIAVSASLVDLPGTRVAAVALRGRIAALRGAWDAAAEDLAQVGGPGLVRARPDDRAAYAVAGVELQAGRRDADAALAAAVEGLVLIGDAGARARAEFFAVAARALVDGILAGRALRTGGGSEEREGLLATIVARTGEAERGDRWVAALLATVAAEAARTSAGTSGPGWVEAGAAWTSLGASWWSAYAAYREADAALTVARDRDAARAALGRAKALADELEAGPLSSDIAALATRSRIELSSRAEPEPPKAERKLPISDREVEVLVLLAQGLTNKEIANQLFISEKTAAHHIEHIFTKLDVTSRVEAAGWAHQAGLTG